MEVLTFHGDYGIEVYLQGLGDAFFDAELLSLVAGIPAAEFGEGEEGGEDDEEYCSVAACC